MIYRETGFLAVVRFGSASTPSPPPHLPVSKLDLRHTGRDRGEGGRGGAKSYDRKKAWPFINYSMLCGVTVASAGGGGSGPK